MKKTLISLTLLLTLSMASTETSSVTNAKNIDILTKGQIVLREARTFRTARVAREARSVQRTTRLNREARETDISKIEKIKDLSSLHLTRVSRKIRENRLIVQTIRETRKVSTYPKLNSKSLETMALASLIQD